MASRLDGLKKWSTSDMLLELTLRGVYPLEVITVDDVMEHAEQEGDKITREAADKACNELWLDREIHIDNLDEAVCRALELSPELQEE